MRRPANHSHVCRKRARQCLAPMNNHLKFVGATHAAPCKPQLRMSKKGEAMPRPYEQSPQIRRGDACVTLQTTATYVERGRGMPRPCEQSRQIRRGDACVALQTTATYVERGRGMPRPYEQSPQIRRGDACVALQTTATHVERGRGNASPLANNHLKFVEGDACVAPQTTATYVERGRGNASPLANNPLKFVGATHASPCKPQPRMSKEGEAMPRPYERHDFVKP